ncbi:hypothetical protein VTH82DRAFT_7249 [Thermothelomyces myriococcoides]
MRVPLALVKILQSKRLDFEALSSSDDASPLRSPHAHRSPTPLFREPRLRNGCASSNRILWWKR